MSETSKPAADRYWVKTETIDPAIPDCCVKCLSPSPDHKRKLSFRRSDGSVERVSVVYWPYCRGCHAELAPFDRQQRYMTLMGGIQTLLVLYFLGGAMAYYDVVMSLAIPASVIAIVAFIYFARKARSLWGLEWARIEDVYKGGVGAAYSFKNEAYAARFADANATTPRDTSMASR